MMRSLVLRRGGLLLAAATLASCKREERRFHEVPPSSPPTQAVTLSGGFTPGPRQPDLQVTSAYLHNAWAVAEGETLYNQMNCSGCHAHGGGSIGPPLMDAQWIYGGEPENIFRSIQEGRPNGMPAWGPRLSAEQMWKLTAYVMSLSGRLPKTVEPGRTDHMQVRMQEQGTPRQHPIPYGGQPPSSVFP
jgi:cytochrome c oxidase cbb3-type subunit 3